MGLFKVRALYDFVGEPNTAEISIITGEVLTVTRTDIGEGWWEGTNSRGQSGLFPEAYVERVAEESQPPSMPPPVLPPQNSWSQPSQEDDWDDEWDNDDTYSEIANHTGQKENFYSNEPNQNQMGYGPGAGDTVSESNFSVDNKGTITKKSLNRFSSYVKSGLESYILGIRNVQYNGFLAQNHKDI